MCRAYNPRMNPTLPRAAKRRAPGTPLRAALALAILLATLPLAGFAAFMVIDEHREEVGHQRRQLLLQAHLYTAGLERTLETARQQLIVLSHSQRVNDPGNVDACRALLADLLALNPLFNNLGVADASGRVRCSALPLNGLIAVADLEWFERARGTRRAVLGTYQLGRTTGQPTVNLAQRLLGDLEATRGVVFAALDLNHLRLLETPALPDGTTLTVLDRRGTVLMRQPAAEGVLGLRHLERGVLEAVERSRLEAVTLDGAVQTTAIAPVTLEGEAGLFVALGEDRTVRLVAVERRLWTVGLTFSAVLLGVMLAFWQGAERFVTGPLAVLATTARQIALGSPTDFPDHSGRVREIAALSTSVATMAHTLQARAHELSRSELRFREMAEKAGVALLLYRPAERRVVYANPAAHALVGVDSFERAEAILPPATLERLRAGAGHGVEVDLRTPSGERRRVEVRLETVEHDGEDALLLTLHDLTAERDAQMQREARAVAERANAAKSEFLAHMSHELRTPLTSILGFAQLLRLEETQPERRDMLERIDRTGKHLVGLINELLDLSRIESGKLRLSPTNLEISELLEDSVQLVAPLATSRGIRLDDGAVHRAEVWADGQRLKQVVLNLLSNAVKYSPHGSVVRIGCAMTATGHLRLWVSDAGPGLPESAQRRLFQPFERLGAPGEGTGLGLALSKRLVDAMGGRLEFESVSGHGATFFVTLPLQPAPAAAASSAPPDALKVLCVDDDLANLRLLNTVLSFLPNSQVQLATLGRQGLELARLQRPDLILLDLSLPDLDGESVLEHLQADEATRGIPVIVISARDEGDLEARLTDLGARAVVAKPFRVEGLQRVIRAVIGEAT
jgi:signal transduction histidine kinase/CheY-like chemotaxis protein/HAMP domain-containing protein